HDARATRRGELGKAGVDLASGGVEARGRVQSAELGVVKRVVHLRAEQQIGAIPPPEVLEHADVPVVNAGAAEARISVAGAAPTISRVRSRPRTSRLHRRGARET